jgi:ABC-type bacteriocin/lantibiotic exporter with double-glycine peptidase domain
VKLLLVRTFLPTLLASGLSSVSSEALHTIVNSLERIELSAVILQLFGLITPIFMQVVMDKVLVHNDVSLLNIVLIGMVIVTLFQMGINILRQYLLVHTTCRQIALRSGLKATTEISNSRFRIKRVKIMDYEC